MVRTSKNDSGMRRWLELEESLTDNIPQVMSVLNNEHDFISIYIKLKEDGTCLGVLKRYGSDGGPQVCFGSGYGVSGCFVALEASIAGNNWRQDKPWPGNGK